jgi:hypothetical protein
MKKNYILLIFLSCFTHLNAQVINGNFETIKENGSVSNWGINFFIPVSLNNETGESIPNQIIFDNSNNVVSSTSQAHSGEHALEIRNAFNVTTNTVMPGGAVIFHDATFDIPGYNFGVPIEANQHPEILGFYYKYQPVGQTDVFTALIAIQNENGNEIGRATILLNASDYVYNPNAEFVYIEAPIIYTSEETAAHMDISFSMGLAENATFGTRIIIDDVVVNRTTLAVNELTNPKFTIYPTITKDELNISGEFQIGKNYSYTLYDIQGKNIRTQNIEYTYNNNSTIDVSDLTSGMYLLSLNLNGNILTEKFIKK